MNMNIVYLALVRVLIGVGTGEAAAAQNDLQRLSTAMHAVVHRQLLRPLPAARPRRGLAGTFCDDFGAAFMDADLDCACTDATDTNTVGIECGLPSVCAYGGSVCFADGGTATFVLEGFDALAALLAVDASARPKTHDLAVTMSSCAPYSSPTIGDFCFTLPMALVVYLTTEGLDTRLKTGLDCAISLNGQDCGCEMDREDEYTGDGEEPCFKTDCSAVLGDAFAPISICKVVIDSQNKLHKSFLLPFREMKRAPAPATVDDPPAAEAAAPSTKADTLAIATASAGDGDTSASVPITDVGRAWRAFALLLGIGVAIF